MIEPAEAYRQGLALARRAGMSWFEAELWLLDVALSVARDDDEREEWFEALRWSRTFWMRAYERRPTGLAL